ncbi:MAG: TonB-dependent receptor [Acidobacteriota bacterium]
MATDELGTHHKALHINLGGGRYGTFAEIGAGQEVARWFFRVGGAAGTVSKTISAYDMTVSDAVYGPTSRYVSRERLQAMLDHEWRLLLKRLDGERGDRTSFFVFADTIAARSYSRPDDGHGWLGIRFQTAPRAEPSEIIIHARMWDKDNVHQQEALGIVGVNLTSGAFFHHQDPEALIRSLMDDLTRDRMEVDMVKFSGPAFTGVDNRLMSLQLVQQRLTNAAVFTADGEVREPAEILYGKPALIERGNFRPVTKVTLDMLESALAQMKRETDLAGQEPVVLTEMTLRNLMTLGEHIEHSDFLARVDTLAALGKTVMVSNYSRFHTVTSYLRRYTPNQVVMVLGVPTLRQIFDEKYYRDVEGGLLEAIGRLFNGRVKLYIHPWRDARTGDLVTAETFDPPPHFHHLYAHLLDNKYIEPVRDFSEAGLSLLPRDILGELQAGDPAWENLVPAPVVEMIKARGYFGYAATTPAPPA